MSGLFPDPPVLIGHRGLGKGTVGGHAGNSLASFLAAAQLVPWVEVDVRRTADDVLFVMHNPAFADGAFLVDLPGEQADARGALRLTDLLDALPASTGVNFDLKTSMEDAGRARTAGTAALLAPVATAAARRRPVLATSFDPAALGVLAELAAGVPRGLLTWLAFPAGHAVAAVAHLGVAVLAVHCGSLAPNLVEPATQQRPVDYVVDLVHRAGLDLLAWCPGQRQGKALAAAGADALCVDDAPAWAAATAPEAAT